MQVQSSSKQEDKLLRWLMPQRVRNPRAMARAMGHVLSGRMSTRASASTEGINRNALSVWIYRYREASSEMEPQDLDQLSLWVGTYRTPDADRVVKALNLHRRYGNITKAAHEAGISRSTLTVWVQRYRAHTQKAGSGVALPDTPGFNWASQEASRQGMDPVEFIDQLIESARILFSGDSP